MKYISVLVGITCLGWALQGNAETVSLQAAKTSPHHTGKTMEQVTKLLGQPDRKSAAVGEPPITRWHYGAHTVYFEQNVVIHTVTHQK